MTTISSTGAAAEAASSANEAKGKRAIAAGISARGALGKERKNMDDKLLVEHTLPLWRQKNLRTIYAETGGALERKARSRRWLSSAAATAAKAMARAGGATKVETDGEPADDNIGAKLRHSSQMACAAGLASCTVAATWGTCE